MDIRLLSFLKVQYQDGPEMDLAETVTFNDVLHGATTLIDRRIQWLDDNHLVQASFHKSGPASYCYVAIQRSGAVDKFSFNRSF